MIQFLNFLLLAADVTPPDTSVAPPPEVMPTYEGAFLKMFLTLLALVVGIFVTRWVLRRMSQGRFASGGGKAIRIVEKKPLSPKTMLYVIEVDGKQSLIAESQFEVRKLMSLDEPPLPKE
jgi:flagellar protein FliO/FliZ